MDLTDLQGLLGQFQPTQADKDAAQKQALIAMGLGLMGARRGQEFSALGQGGLLGLNTYQNAMQNTLKQRQEGMQSAAAAMQMQNMLQQYNDDQTARRIAQGAPTGQPAVVPVPGSKLPTVAGIQPPGGAPAPIAAAASAAPAAPATPSGSPDAMSRMAKFQAYSALADQYLHAGLLKQSQAMSDLAEKFRPQLDTQKTLTTPDGKRVVVNVYKDGSTQVVQGLDPDLEKAVQLDNGKQITAVSPYTLQPIPGGGVVNKTTTPGEDQAARTAAAGQAITMRGQNMTNSLGYANLNETKRYHDIEQGVNADGTPTNTDAVAQAIAHYQQPPLSSFAMARPIGARIMSRVQELNPEYDAKNYATAQQTANAFSKGTQGNTVRSINVAMQHLDTLGQAADALDNGNYPLLNKVSNAIATQTGGAAPTNFNAVKDIVANEIVKAIAGSGGGVSDRDKAQQTVAAANSPAQLKTVINSYRTLFTGQLGGLKQQYESGTQRKDFEKFLSPETLSLMTNKGGAAAPKIIDFSQLPK